MLFLINLFDEISFGQKGQWVLNNIKVASNINISQASSSSVFDIPYPIRQNLIFEYRLFLNWLMVRESESIISQVTQDTPENVINNTETRQLVYKTRK